MEHIFAAGVYGFIAFCAVAVKSAARQKWGTAREFVTAAALAYPILFTLLFSFRGYVLFTGSGANNHFLSASAAQSLPWLLGLAVASALALYTVGQKKTAVATGAFYLASIAFLFVCERYNIALTYDDWIARGMPGPFHSTCF